MSDSDYIRGTDHARTLSNAMNDFHEALTYRWREVVTEKIVAGQHDYPITIKASHAPHGSPAMWDYMTAGARNHLSWGGGSRCGYVAWIEGGQEGELSAVTCKGETGVDEDTGVLGPDGQPQTIPPNIECGMGSILEMVEDWAWGEREYTYYELPLFDTHDVGAIESAHNAFIEVGGKLGLEAQAGSDSGVNGSFTPVSERELAGKVEDLAGERGQGQDWWAGWTGLAASRAKAGFFSSVAPSMNNQSGIAGSLANLYSARAAIIEKGRNDALYWIQWGTKSLKETQTITTDLVKGWKTVQGIGGAIQISGGWSGVGGAVGAAVTLVGFLGENLLPKITTEAYKYDLVEVVEKLNSEVDGLNKAVNGLELEYTNEVTELHDTIFSIHSYNLELYDLTQNSSDGDDSGSKGYTANVDDILKIGQTCYEAADLYDDLLPALSRTFTADKHLADKDGQPTSGDNLLVAARDLLEGFVKTACGRYVVAADEVKAAAEAYAKTDAEQKAVYDRVMADWKEADVDYDGELDGNKEAEATDRSGYKPGGSHPTTGGSTPGAGDGQDYETD